MAKLTLSHVDNLENQTSACALINANSAATATALENTLSRDGTAPNQMNSTLDMNSNQIINLPTPTSVNSPARLIDVTLATGGVATGTLSGNNNWSGSNNFLQGIKLNGDIVLTHPLNPSSSVGLPGTNITLGLLAGSAISVIPATNYLTLLGYAAGRNITTADHITAVGAFALENYTISTASPGNSPSLTAIGIDAMRAFTTGEGNTAIGEHTMTANTTISNSVAIGNGAMFNAGGIRNTAIGGSAMLGAFPAINYLSGNDNVAVGFSALAALGTTSATNTAVGAYALTSALLTNANVAIGYLAGATITTGSFNTIIGQAAGGTTLTTGSQNILIGLGADTPTASTGSYLNIGGWIYGDAANFIRVKGAVGTKPPLAVPTGTSATVGADDSVVVINPSGSFTLTLPAAATYPGRWLCIKNIGNQTISSNTSNVGPLTGGAAATAILPATIGKWAMLQSNGVYWEIMMAN